MHKCHSMLQPGERPAHTVKMMVLVSLDLLNFFSFFFFFFRFYKGNSNMNKLSVYMCFLFYFDVYTAGLLLSEPALK